MSRFFVEEKNIRQDSILIEDREDVKHLTKVLRHKAGDVIEISDGKRFEYEMEIETLSNECVQGKILTKREFEREPQIKVTLYQALPKQGKMEVIVQKSVELGVYEILPMVTERTVVLDKGNFARKTQRWQKVADEAVKQCRRGIIPQVLEPVTLDAVLSLMGKNDLNLFFYEEETVQTLKSILRNCQAEKVKRIGVFIGPEGGFSPAEAEKIVAAGAVSVSMGKTILRVETASVASVAMVTYEMELRG